jgi:hypothetical protein
MGVIPELAHVFETKMRAPFKCVFEVCRLSELMTLAQPESDAEKLDVDESPVLDQSLKQSGIFNDDDGSGTGGIGGLFSMTVNDEEVGHFTENCFADDAESTEAKPETIEEVKIEQAKNLNEDASSRASGEIQLDDWVEIDANFYTLMGVRPPDIMTDPFKERWSQVKCQYKKISKWKDR